MKAASLLNLFFICLCCSIPLTGQQLSIVDPPKEDLVVENGKPVHVGCKVTNCHSTCTAQLHKDQLMIWQKETGFHTSLKDEFIFIGNKTEGDFTIRIPKPSIKTDGFYKCKFVQVEGGKIQRPIETVSAYINVTVKPEKPQINSVKNDKLFLIKKRKEGVEKAEILCTSNLGKPPPVIRLQVGDNQPLLPTSIKSEASGSTEEMRKLRNVTAKFEIDLDRSLENVKVTCSATNYATKQLRLSLESSAVIKILSAPTIHIRQTPQGHVIENDTVIIECWSTGEPEVSNWRWKENSSSINIKTSSLKFRARRRYHATNFSCFGDNGIDIASKSVVLMVQYPPQFLNAAENVQINLTMNESVELKCKVDAYPTAIVYWTKDGRNIHAGETYKFIVNSRSKLGKYVCTAYSVRFRNVSRTIYVLQKHKPNIISDQTQVGEYQAKGSLICTALAQPAPVFSLYKGGKLVPISVLDKLSSITEEILGGAKYTVTFTKLESKDFGEYNCTAKNTLGSDWKIINFEETKSPDLKYILIGSIAGLLIVIVLIVIMVFCKLRQHSSSDSNASTTPMHVEPIKNVVDVDKKDHFPDDNICNLSNYSEHWDYSTYPGDFIYDQHYPETVKESYLPTARPDSRLSTNV